MLTGGGGELEVKLAEHVSPVEQEPVNLAPSLSRSKANWWSVSVLDSVIVTTSPWLTVIVGFVTGPLAFQPETVPDRWRVMLAAWAVGTVGRRFRFDVWVARPIERASRIPQAIITAERMNTYYCYKMLITPLAQMNGA